MPRTSRVSRKTGRSYKPKASAKSKPKAVRRSGSRKTRFSKGSSIMPTTKKFAMASMDPFSSIVDNVTCPTYPSCPTFKRKGVISGTFTTNPSGYAFVAATPNLSSNYFQLYTSDLNYVGWDSDSQPNAGAEINRIDCRSIDGGQNGIGIGVNGYYSNAFPGGQELTDGTQTKEASYAGRIVAVGIRVRYIGTEDNIGGLIYAKVHPNHQTVQYDTVEDWADSASTVCVPVSREWTMISSIGVKRQEFEFPAWNPDYGVEGTNDEVRAMVFPWSGFKAVGGGMLDSDEGCPVMGIQISGTVPKSQFQYEYIIHNEYIGEKTVGIKTNNATEPLALERTTAVTNQKNVSRDDDRTPGKALMKAAASTGDASLADIFAQCYGNFTEGVYEGGMSMLDDMPRPHQYPAYFKRGGRKIPIGLYKLLQSYGY